MKSAHWNVVQGCTQVGPGCRSCWPMNTVHQHAANVGRPGISLPVQGLTAKPPHGRLGWTGSVALRWERVDDPSHWGAPRLVTVANHGDLFHENVPDDFVLSVFRVAYRNPRHTYLVLTRRPERLARFAARLCWDERRDDLYLAPHGGRPWLPTVRNVWCGVACENQYALERRVHHLLAAPVGVRWLNLEPLLEPVKIGQWTLSEYERKEGTDPLASRAKLDWVTVGGEYGPAARPFHLEWLPRLMADCTAGRVPLYVRQLGGHLMIAGQRVPLLDKTGATFEAEWPYQYRVRQWPAGFRPEDETHAVEV